MKILWKEKKAEDGGLGKLGGCMGEVLYLLEELGERAWFLDS